MRLKCYGVEEALHGLCGLNMSLLFLQASVDSSVNGVHLLLACLRLGLMVRIEGGTGSLCMAVIVTVLQLGGHMRIVVHYLTRANASVFPVQLWTWPPVSLLGFLLNK